MANAEELFAGAFARSTIVDKTLVVDNDFRTIKIPSSVPNLGVEHDDDVLRLHFKMPRYIGNDKTIDLSGFAIRINYINATGETGVYTVQINDDDVDNEYIHFSWLVGPTATRYKGDTRFNVCAVTLNSDNEVEKEFNTTVATLPVLEGLEVDEAIVTAYSDIIEQWRRELFGIGDTEEASIKRVSQNEQTAIEAKGAEVLATIPAEYTETYEAAQEGIRTKADAIVCEAQGDIISVFDSSYDHVRNLKIFGKTTQVTTTGKQLIKVTKTSSTTNGITYTVNADGSVHVRGTATGNAYFIIDSNNPISIRGSELIAAISGSDKVYMTIGYFKDDSTIVNEVAYALGNASCSFTYPSEAVTTRTFLGVNTGVTVDAVVYPMIRLATIEDSSYEPYSGGIASPSPDWPQEMNDIENPTISVYGKNLLKLVTSNQTTNGVTFTVNPDNSVSIKGTATASVYYGLNYDIKTLIPGEQYTMTGGLEGSSGTTYRLYAQTIDGKKFYADYGNGVSFTATDEQWQVLFAVYKDTTVDFTIYPVLRLKSVVDATYEPYTDQPTVSLQRSLAGIPVTEGGNYTDTNGQQWICDEIDFDRGVYIQRTYRYTFDGTENWKASGFQYDENNIRYDYADTSAPGQGSAVCLSTHFKYNGVSNPGVWVNRDRLNYAEFRIMWTYATVEELKDFLATQNANGTPVEFIYILATPIETPLSAEEISAFKAVHTNHPNTTVLNDAGATMELTYNVDIKTWVRTNTVRMDNATVGADVWSSKNTVDKLTPTFTKSGAVITCNPVEGYPLEITADDGAIITRCKKNLLNLSARKEVKENNSNTTKRKFDGNKAFIGFNNSNYLYSRHINSYTLTEAGMTFNVNTGWYGVGYDFLVKPGVTYTLSAEVDNANTSLYLTFYREDGTCIAGKNSSVCEAPENAKWAVASVIAHDEAIGQDIVVTNMMVEANSIATEYEPYQGGTFVIGETITTLQGANTIYADVGLVTVKGKADPTVIIQNLLEGGGGSGGSVGDAVLYTEQTLTTEQQVRARKNIGAVTLNEVINALPVYKGEVEVV